MQDARALAVLGAIAMSKHQAAGTAAVVIGALLVAFGAIRAMTRVARSALLPLVGVGVLVVGVLLFTRTI